MTELQVTSTAQLPQNFKQPLFTVNLHWKKKKIVVKVNLFGVRSKEGVRLTITRNTFKLKTVDGSSYFLGFKFPRQTYVIYYETTVSFNFDTLSVSMPIAEMYDNKTNKKVYVRLPEIKAQSKFAWDGSADQLKKTALHKKPNFEKTCKTKSQRRQAKEKGSGTKARSKNEQKTQARTLG